MNRENILKEIVGEFIAFAPDFKRYFLTIGRNSGEANAPKLTSLQYMAVVALGLSKEGALTMNALAGMLNISKQQATKLMDGLVEDNYIERYTNPHNRREVLTELSKEGLVCLKKIQETKLNFLLEYTRAFTDDEVAELLGHVRALNELFKRGAGKCEEKECEES